MFFLYFVLHREHHWWIAYAKLNPPEGLCIFGIWSMYCYDCQFMSLWFMFLFVAILVTLFLELLMYIENIIDGLLTRSWIRPKAFVFMAYVNLLLWLPLYIIMIFVTLFLELLMKVMYAVKRLKLLHLIVCVFINTSLACSYVALLVFSMFTLNCDFNLCCVFFFTLRIVAFVFYYSFIGCV